MHEFLKDIRFNLVLPEVKANNNKKAFEVIAEEAAPICGLPEEDLLERFLDREKIASSGIGGGVAIPHMKFRRLNKPFMILAKMHKEVEFKAVDGEPVDLVCIVMSPDKDGPIHLRRLSRITRLLRNNVLCNRLREAEDSQSMIDVLMETDSWGAMAA